MSTRHAGACAAPMERCTADTRTWRQVRCATLNSTLFGFQGCRVFDELAPRAVVAVHFVGAAFGIDQRTALSAPGKNSAAQFGSGRRPVRIERWRKRSLAQVRLPQACWTGMGERMAVTWPCNTSLSHTPRPTHGISPPVSCAKGWAGRRSILGLVVRNFVDAGASRPPVFWSLRQRLI